MSKKTTSDLEKAMKDFKTDPSPENELKIDAIVSEIAANALEVKKAKEAADTSNIVKAVVAATKMANRPKHRPTKTQVDKLITCDEFVVQESEGSPGTITVVEPLRTGVKITKEAMARVNAPAMTQSRAKVLVPTGKIKTYLQELSEKRKAKLN